MNPEVLLHLDAAERNQTIARELLQSFSPDVHPPQDDWVITVTFYSALHLIDAFLLEVQSDKPESHAERDRRVRNDPVLTRVADDYRALKNASIVARYRPMPVFSPYAVQQAFDQLEEIRSVVRSTLDAG